MSWVANQHQRCWLSAMKPAVFHGMFHSDTTHRFLLVSCLYLCSIEKNWFSLRLRIFFDFPKSEGKAHHRAHIIEVRMKPSMTFSKASFLHILGPRCNHCNCNSGTGLLANNHGKGCHKITLRKLMKTTWDVIPLKF